MTFLIENWQYMALMVVSGGMLLWPTLQKRNLGALVNANGAIALMNDENALLLDVRTSDQFARGRVAQAKNVPVADVASRAAELIKSASIVVMGDAGANAGKAASALRAAGAAKVVVLDGGYSAWQAAGLPVKK